MKCIKCGEDKDESGYLFTDFGSEFDNPEFICVDCSNKIPDNLTKS